MSYTLAKWALWLIGAAAIGVVIGWLLRGLRGLRGAPAAEAFDDAPDEVAALRARVASLEPLINEREKLRIQLEDCREMAAEAKATVTHAPLPTRQPPKCRRARRVGCRLVGGGRPRPAARRGQRP